MKVKTFEKTNPAIVYVMQNEDKKIEDLISTKIADIEIKDREDEYVVLINPSLNKKFLDFIGYINSKNDKIEPVAKLNTIVEKQVNLENIVLKFLKNNKYYTINIKKAKGMIRANMFYIPADSVGFINFEIKDENNFDCIHFYYKLSTNQLFFNWLEERDEEIQFLNFKEGEK